MLERDKQALSHHAHLHKVIAVLLMRHFYGPGHLQGKRFTVVGENLWRDLFSLVVAASDAPEPRCETLCPAAAVGCL